jgi:hypothetical protein
VAEDVLWRVGGQFPGIELVYEAYREAGLDG